jgi:type VI protein secretion system component VasF
MPDSQRNACAAEPALSMPGDGAPDLDLRRRLAAMAETIREVESRAPHERMVALRVLIGQAAAAACLHARVEPEDAAELAYWGCAASIEKLRIRMAG